MSVAIGTARVVGEVEGWKIVDFWRDEKGELKGGPRPEDQATFGVKTERLCTWNNHWPTVFVYWFTQEAAEAWVSEVLVPSLQRAARPYRGDAYPALDNYAWAGVKGGRSRCS